MSERLPAYLRDHPEGVTPEQIARDVFRLEGPPRTLARLAESALASIPGVAPGPDGRYRPAAAPAPAGQAGEGQAGEGQALDGQYREGQASEGVAVEIRSTGPWPPVDAVLEVAVAGRDGSAFASFVRPPRVPPVEALRAAGVEAGDLEGAPPLDAVLDRVAPLVDGARLVSFRSTRPGVVLRRALAASSRPERPADTLALLPALWREGLLGEGASMRTATLADAAAALGVAPPASDRAGPVARVVMQVYLAARERGIGFEPPARAGFDFGKTEFGPETLAEIPPRPGIYRFLDEEGRLLYVGKSCDLRRRVTSYFDARAKRRRRHAELMARLYRIEWEETGSDLVALLAEAEEIRRREPELNVAREVRPLREAKGEHVLFLPGRAEGEIDLILVRDGAPTGRATSDARARGMREVRAALRGAFFSGDPGPPWEADAGDARLVATWLRREGDRVNSLDLREVSGLAEAARRVKAFLRDPDLFTRKVWHR